MKFIHTYIFMYVHTIIYIHVLLITNLGSLTLHCAMATGQWNMRWKNYKSIEQARHEKKKAEDEARRTQDIWDGDLYRLWLDFSPLLGHLKCLKPFKDSMRKFHPKTTLPIHPNCKTFVHTSMTIPAPIFWGRSDMRAPNFVDLEYVAFYHVRDMLMLAMDPMDQIMIVDETGYWHEGRHRKLFKLTETCGEERDRKVGRETIYHLKIYVMSQLKIHKPVPCQIIDFDQGKLPAGPVKESQAASSSMQLQ